MLNFYVLRDDDGLFLIDGGFIGGMTLLQRALKKQRWDHLQIQGIIVTHGHLDHVLNLTRLKKETGAWIAAPKADELHYRGQYPYRGVTRVCGLLEAAGRRLLGYRPFPIDRQLSDGDVIDVWDGLRAVHLPGHTVGHMGYYSASRRLVFGGDIFASYARSARWPLPFFNSCPELLEGSRQRLLGLRPCGILPNHGDDASPETHLDRFRKLKRRDHKPLPSDV
jgi:glyoxylase-like metal-dependent hydrolase (beta-lactamase superfamily II)